MSTAIVSAPQRGRKVVLRIPEGMAFQLVYRMEMSEPFPLDERAAMTFHHCKSPVSFLRRLPALRTLFSWAHIAKGALKVLTPRRSFYMVTADERILHYGWTTAGLCRYYRVEPGDTVIGPIWSAENARGRGVATFATRRVMNESYKAGRRTFFIDTSNDNIPCQKVIANCGFGDPVAVYLRN